MNNNYDDFNMNQPEGTNSIPDNSRNSSEVMSSSAGSPAAHNYTPPATGNERFSGRYGRINIDSNLNTSANSYGAGIANNSADNGTNSYERANSYSRANSYTRANSYAGVNSYTNSSTYTGADSNSNASNYSQNAGYAKPQTSYSGYTGISGQGSTKQEGSGFDMSSYYDGRNMVSDYYQPEQPAEEAVASESIDEKRKKTEKRRSKAKEEKPAKAKTKKGSGKIGKLIASALVFGIVAGAAFEGVHFAGSKLTQNNTTAQVTTESNVELASSANPGEVTTQALASGNSSSTMNYDVADIAEKAQTSLVSITTTVTTTYQYFYQQYQEEQQGAGSGVIIGKDANYLYIVTNYHVIQNANEINVGFSDGEVVKASVKGYDSDQDIAVVAVPFSDMKDSTASTITIAQIGDSDQLKVGEPVVAVGNALGYGQSVTVGYISALNRTIEGAEGTYIQTDAAINPGNSGGALLDSKGQLIGINSVKYVDSKVEGMGFSIPVNKAMSIVEDIINGTKEKPYIGISGVDISKEYSQIYGFPEGIYVKELKSGAPAEKGGIHTGDIIVEFNGQTVYTMEELQKVIANCKEGDKVKVVVYRQGITGSYEKQELELTIEKGFVG